MKNNEINIFVGKFDDFNEKTGIVILTDFSRNYSRNLEHQMCVTMYIVFTYYLLLTDILSLDAVGSSGILIAKQKLGVIFNFDKQDAVDFTKF